MKHWLDPIALSVLLFLVSACSSPPDTATAPLDALSSDFSEEKVGHDAEAEMWVKDRLAAVMSLYSITPEGREKLQDLDVRWMRDEPGFFGSYGYKSWTGVGEAKPQVVMHELSHSYWGLFPVTGLPHLSWHTPQGGGISAAMERYHQDVLAFMQQPPDHYEILRSRLKNVPGLASTDLNGLFHTVEADAVYTAAGDLDLVPPILKKYWDQFLQPGPYHTWYETTSWYEGLSTDDKRYANVYLGFEHFELSAYVPLKSSEPTQLRQGVKETLVKEETQRLEDFTELFDLLVGNPEHEKDFKFWRRYLRDKVQLHKQHPDIVTSLGLPRSEEISGALDFLQSIEGNGDEKKARLVIEELDPQPFLAHFLPALNNRTLLTLFTSEAQLPKGATLKGTAAFVNSLEKFTPHVNNILKAGHRDVSAGADELTNYLKKQDFQEEEDLELFFEFLQGSDNDMAKAVVAAVDDSMLRQLLEAVPARLRFLLSSPRFLEFLNITLDSSPRELTRGIQDMVAYPSGNFRIDEPFVDEMYRVVATRARLAPLETLNVIAGPTYPMERFISLYPAIAADLLATDLNIAVETVRDSDRVLFPAPRFVYRLIYADPELSATLVERLDQLGERALVVESLAYFAYDAERQQIAPRLPISLRRDGRFLEELLTGRGKDWLEEQISEAGRLYAQRAERQESPADFVAAYRDTLEMAVDTVADRNARRSLEEIIDRVF